MRLKLKVSNKAEASIASQISYLSSCAAEVRQLELGLPASLPQPWRLLSGREGTASSLVRFTVLVGKQRATENMRLTVLMIKVLLSLKYDEVASICLIGHKHCAYSGNLVRSLQARIQTAIQS